jgi:hypothetical protein
MIGYIIALVLAIAVLPMPYGYYTIVRIGTTTVSAIYCTHYLSEDKINIVYIFGFVAILFNPLIPIYLEKEIWVFIDIIAAGLFIYFKFD